uniref:Uncharacterized protein n=1 Tax=Leviviridae sp. TaxID=2027243 RepID=A0A514D5A0_9VIRU|nr:MAG: hypothetical protein H3BulkL16333e3931_000002 [Leviviridae sp.]
MAYIPLESIISISDKVLVVDVQKAHMSIGSPSRGKDEDAIAVPRLTPIQQKRYNWKIIFLMLVGALQASMLAVQDWENVFQALS